MIGIGPLNFSLNILPCTHLSDDAPETSNFMSSLLWAGHNAMNGWTQHRAIPRFDISSLPSGKVESAVLGYTPASWAPFSTTQNYCFSRLIAAHAPTQATWNRASIGVAWPGSPGASTPDVDFTSENQVVFSVPAGYQWAREVEIPNLLQDALDLGLSVLELLLHRVSAGAVGAFGSSKALWSLSGVITPSIQGVSGVAPQESEEVGMNFRPLAPLTATGVDQAVAVPNGAALQVRGVGNEVEIRQKIGAAEVLKVPADTIHTLGRGGEQTLYVRAVADTVIYLAIT